MPYFRSRRGYRTIKRKRYARRSTKYPRRKKTIKRRKVANRKYPGLTKTRGFVIPRLRIPTMRQKSRMLRLQKDMEWTLAPEWTTVPNECCHLRIRANSVLDILADPGAGQSGGLPNNVWRANDPAYTAVGGQQILPDGLTLWQGQYYHFTVVASKISIVINQTDGTDLHTGPGGVYQPSLAFLTKLGTQVNFPIGNNTTKEQLMKIPYTVLAETYPNKGNSSGVKLSLGYSAKRFESVPSPLSASQLRGSLPLPGGTIGPAQQPNEQSYFILGLVPQRGYAASTTDYMQPHQVQVKIEYSVVLTEPCPDELPGVPPGPGAFAATAAAAAAAAMDDGGDI